MHPILRSVLPVLLGILLSPAAGNPARGADAAPTVKVRTRDELEQAVRRAQPGTTIRIAAGTYRGGLSFSKIRGAKDQPIVLAAEDARQPPVFSGGGSCFHFSGPAYVELQDLVLTGATGNGLNVDDGGAQDNPAHHIVLRNLQLREIGPDGNRDGIKLSGVEDFVIEGCSVDRWGNSGSAIDMVGCHRGRVVDCTFKHRGDLPANGVQTKGGSSGIVIQYCRFENAGGRAVNIGGSTGADYFRPRGAGYEARDITVEDCTLIGSMAPICFVGSDRAVVRYNTIYRPARWGVRILQESRGAEFVPCRNGSFTNNLIAFRSDEIRTMVNVGDGVAPDTFTFAKNQWYCIDNPRLSGRLSLPVQEADGRYGVNPQFADEARHDLQLAADSPVRGAGVRVRKEGSGQP